MASVCRPGGRFINGRVPEKQAHPGADMPPRHSFTVIRGASASCVPSEQFLVIIQLINYNILIKEKLFKAV